uniref:Glycosyl transferase CAP10 domain-containing protein n=1 Tax=viral metagenome TaxID=1070528 RepID=A0A6C0H687_9ZZZZ
MNKKFVYNYFDALSIGKEYLHQNIFQDKNNVLNKNYILPFELKNGPWDINIDSLKLTLDYIFNHLHHNCYMVCVYNNNIKMCKLQNMTTAPILKPILGQQLKELKNNDKITNYQKKYISDFIKNNQIRIMQCIVKKYIIKDDDDDDENEYHKIIKNINLPNGVFIFNLTDAIILKKDETEPWDMVFSNRKLPKKYCGKKFIPIFSSSGHVDYWDIPMPTYDDLFYVLKINLNFNLDKINTDWKKKNINKAIFRGSPTGCGYTIDTNTRLKITTFDSPFLDVGITSKNIKSINSISIRFDPVYGLGMLNTNIKPSSFITMENQSFYKYIIYIDGNVHAYRLLTILSLGSVVLRVMSKYTSWIDTILKPNIHYLPIASDLSNLLDVVNWCNNNDVKCKKIANNGMKFAKKVLTYEYISFTFHDLFWQCIDPIFINKNGKRCPKGYKKNDNDESLCVKKII